MIDSDVYEDTAWKGEIPENLQLVDDPENILDTVPTPSSKTEFFAGTRMIIYCVLGFVWFGAFVCSIIGSFGHGLYLHKMLDDTFTIYSLFCLFTSTFILVVCICFERQYIHKYSEYLGYYNPISSKFGARLYSRLDFTAVYSVLPSQILNLIDLVPSRWNQRGFKDKKGRATFYWDEQHLIEYGLKQRFLYQTIKVANLFNWVFIFIGWPLLITQMTTEEVYTPAYIAILALSVLLFVARIMTKHKGDIFTRLQFSRRDGYVTFIDYGEYAWKCHFTELNCYVNHVRDPKYGTTTYVLVLVPRYPIGVSRSTAILQEWAFSNENSVLELWRVINQFMNITSPLPFVIPLDAIRDKDPTTCHASIEANLEQCTGLNLLTDDGYRNLLKERQNTHFYFESAEE